MRMVGTVIERTRDGYSAVASVRFDPGKDPHDVILSQAVIQFAGPDDVDGLWMRQKNDPAATGAGRNTKTSLLGNTLRDIAEESALNEAEKLSLKQIVQEVDILEKSSMTLQQAYSDLKSKIENQKS